MMGVFYTCRRRGCICACARADPFSIPATRTTNLRSAALPQKRCLAVTEGWLNIVHDGRVLHMSEAGFGPQRYPKSAASQSPKVG